MVNLARRSLIGSLVVAGVLSAVVLVSIVRWAASSSPEIPGNAVLDFGSDVVLGDYDGAWDRLCSELRADALGGEGERLADLNAFLRHQGNVSTNYATEIDGDSAREPITVRPRGVRDDRSNEQWVAHLVREDGKWRVCGFERAQ